LELTIDYISDLHRDTYLRFFQTQKEYEDYIFGDKAGEILFVLGDVAEKGNIVVSTLASLKERYKRVIFVAGNHDLYVEHIGSFKSKSSTEKADILKKALADAGVEMLTGESIEINGVKIGGSHMWYDETYLMSKKGSEDIKRRFMSYWNMFMRDAGMLGRDGPFGIFEREIKKLEVLKDEVDVFLSHINPVPLDAYFAEEFRGDLSNTFFCFDGRKALETGKIKHFFFGHTHVGLEMSYANVKLHCNPFGYPGEAKIKDRFVKTVKIAV